MSICRLSGFFLVAGLILLCLAASSKAQTLPSAAGPQQMVPYSAPTSYPSTATPAAELPALSPYGSLAPALVASAPGGPGTIPGPALSGDSGPLYTPYGSGGSDGAALGRPLDTNAYVERSLVSNEPWTWQMLPNGLMYKSYLAATHEPRMGSQWVHERNLGWLWDIELGGRVGLLRYGTDNDFWPEGWQLDFEGAAFPRLELDHNRDLNSVDFRAGVPLTTRQGPFEAKFGYYHLSSHIGDEYLVQYPTFSRFNYVRESLVAGLAVYLNPAVRLYSEAGYAFYTDGGAQPWEFQFGADVSPAEPTSAFGAPFFAINGHLRQENDFGGNMTVQTGWQWRGRSGHLLRLGMQYFNGMSNQYQFFNRFEEQIGAGLWYDF